jgi:hypothetical protein
VAVITEAEARAAVPGLSTTDPSGLLPVLISRADSLCAAWCGFTGTSEAGRPTFDTSTYTRYLEGPGGRDLQLPVWPIVTVTTIEDDTTEDFNGSTYLVSSSDYTAMRRGIVRLKQTAAHGSWSRSSFEVIKAVWTAGWTAASAPEPVKHAVVAMTGILWGTRNTLAASSVSSGAQNVSAVTPDLPRHVQQWLAPYRLIGAYGSIP